MHNDYKTRASRRLTALVTVVLSSMAVYAQVPVNDACSGAITIISNNSSYLCASTTSGTSEGATSSGIFSDLCDNADHEDVWYSFTAANADYRVILSNVNATNAATVYHEYTIAIYSGSCNDLTEVNCNYGYEDVGFDPALDIGIDVAGLTIGEVYYIQVYSSYAIDEDYEDIVTGIDFDLCIALPPPPPSNDDATGAIALTVGAPCTGNIYYNDNATLGTGEPYANCSNGSLGEHSVWFEFEAPASGAVKISTDIGPMGTLSDTKIGLFEASDPANYSTFNIIGCDEDNGAVAGDYTSIIYAAGLVGGQTYYIEVDGYSDTDYGSFCLTVEEINPTMLADAAACADIQSPYGSDDSYAGWVSLVDESGKLVAMVQNSVGEFVGDYYGSYNVDGSGFLVPRLDGNGVAYLARNYMISTFSPIVAPKEVRFFFHPGEIATLAGFTNQATTLANLNVTHQEGDICNPDFLEENGPTSVLIQTANGSVNGVSWVQVTTPDFSNFYLMGGSVPLDVTLEDIAATNVEKANRIDWVVVQGTNDNYFVLERSVDGKHFDVLDKIPAKTQEAYTYWDNTPLLGTNYYRLKIVAQGGKYQYSQVVSAQVTIGNGHLQIRAYPNPVTKTLQVNAPWGTQATIGIYDLAGRQLQEIKVLTAVTDIDMSSLAPGVYFIKYKNDTHQETIRITKQ